MTTRSGRASATSATPSTPSRATRVSCPNAVRRYTIRSRFSALSSTTSTRAISAGRERDGEGAAHTQFAFHQDSSAEELGEFLADVEAETRALELAGFCCTHLFEGAEQELLVLGRDSHAGI